MSRHRNKRVQNCVRCECEGLKMWVEFPHKLRCELCVSAPSSRGQPSVDFSVKLLRWSDKEKVRLQLWDIAGQERFISMTRIYYKGALGCVVMFDVTSSSSFSSCRHWKQDLDNKAMLPNGDSIPCILVANKCDLAHRAVSADTIDKFSKAHGFITWMETSVKDNKNVEEAMRMLAQEILSVQSTMDPIHRPEFRVYPHPDSEFNRSSGEGRGCC
ncbi:ras-related protein Rab-7L1 isoform X2 [Oreochromis niloticus]|uniref:ras-related protein Rab-7L1 isoform X2 n=1 Tax=Oreochromis niloticus TaxID=8128 RepID=UPI000DF15521|nr:ras-related protein Rab-7L1 isoform X2 [Oreochromis niloticus]